MKHFCKTVLETVQKDIEAIERNNSMFGLIEWWAVTENEGTGVSGRDQWQFVMGTYPEFVERVLKQYMEDAPHPMNREFKIHWRDIDDHEVMTAYIEEMGGIDNI